MRRLLYFLPLSFVLSTSLYAADAAPAFVLRVPDSIRTLFIAETSKFVLHRYENTSGTDVTHGGESYMSIGQNGDGKQAYQENAHELWIPGYIATLNVTTDL